MGTPSQRNNTSPSLEAGVWWTVIALVAEHPFPFLLGIPFQYSLRERNSQYKCCYCPWALSRQMVSQHIPPTAPVDQRESCNPSWSMVKTRSFPENFGTDSLRYFSWYNVCLELLVAVYSEGKAFLKRKPRQVRDGGGSAHRASQSTWVHHFWTQLHLLVFIFMWANKISFLFKPFWAGFLSPATKSLSPTLRSGWYEQNTPEAVVCHDLV